MTTLSGQQVDSSTHSFAGVNPASLLPLVRGESAAVTAILDLLPVGVYVCDAEGRIILCNKRATEIWGQVPRLNSPEQLFCGSCKAFLPSGERILPHQTPMALAVTEGKVFKDLEVIVERPDGSRIHASVSIEPLTDEHGKPAGAINVFHDITDHRQTKTQLHALTERMSRIIEKFPAAVYTCDPNGFITHYNEAAVRLWGRAPIIGKDRWCACARVFDADGKTEIKPDEYPIVVALRERRAIRDRELIMERDDGARRVIRPHPEPLFEDGRVVGVLNMLVDITEARRTESAQALLASIVTSSDDAIISKTLTGIITSWNAGAERIFGYTPDEIIGRHITALIPPERHGEEVNIIARLRRGERIDHFQTVRQTKSGRHIDVSITVSPLRDSSGQIIGASKVLRDITDQVRAQRILERQNELLEEAVRERTAELQESHERLRLSERMASLGTLSAGLGHDMGNLLVPVRVCLESLDRANLAPDLRDDIQRIRTSADYLQRLANGLRLMVLDPDKSYGDEVVELGSWWADAGPIIKNALPRTIDFRSDVPPGERIRMPRAALTQVVFNLVQNAGEAIVAARLENFPSRASQPRTFVSVSVRPDGNHVLIDVEDNGPGMTDEIRARCMDPFFTTKTRSISTGFGLVLVGGLVRDAGGTVDLNSTLGKGTRFTLRLPAAGEAPPRPAVQPRAAVAIASAHPRALAIAELRALGFEIVKDGAFAPNLDLLVTDAPSDGCAPNTTAAKPSTVVVINSAASSHAAAPAVRSSALAIRDAIRNAARSLRDQGGAE